MRVVVVLCRELLRVLARYGSCGAVRCGAVRVCRIRCQQSEDKARRKNRTVATMGAGQLDRQRTSMRQCVRRAQRVRGRRWCQERGHLMVVVSKVICVGEAA